MAAPEAEAQSFAWDFLKLILLGEVGCWDADPVALGSNSCSQTRACKLAHLGFHRDRLKDLTDCWEWHPKHDPDGQEIPDAGYVSPVRPRRPALPRLLNSSSAWFHACCASQDKDAGDHSYESYGEFRLNAPGLREAAASVRSSLPWPESLPGSPDRRKRMGYLPEDAYPDDLLERIGAQAGDTVEHRQLRLEDMIGEWTWAFLPHRKMGSYLTMSLVFALAEFLSGAIPLQYREVRLSKLVEWDKCTLFLPVGPGAWRAPILSIASSTVTPTQEPWHRADGRLLRTAVVSFFRDPVDTIVSAFRFNLEQWDDLAITNVMDCTQCENQAWLHLFADCVRVLIDTQGATVPQQCLIRERLLSRTSDTQGIEVEFFNKRGYILRALRNLILWANSPYVLHLSVERFRRDFRKTAGCMSRFLLASHPQHTAGLLLRRGEKLSSNSTRFTKAVAHMVDKLEAADLQSTKQLRYQHRRPLQKSVQASHATSARYDNSFLKQHLNSIPSLQEDLRAIRQLTGKIAERQEMMWGC